jgi:tRNA dimethylallyltransferase
VGHTAAGKSQIVEAVAARFGAQVLSVDSMQVYKGMDIGTAKPSEAVRAAIPHHMIDLVEPAADYDVVNFQTDARVLLGELGAEQRVVIAGGSGLHFRAVVDPLTFAPTDVGIRAQLESAYDAESRKAMLLEADGTAASVVDVSNDRRVLRALEVWTLTGQTPSERASSPEALEVRAYKAKLPHVSIGIDAGDRAHERVNTRFEQMVEAGLVAEVDSLACSLSRTASQAVGYKEILGAIRGETTLVDAVEEAKRRTRGLVKRQRTYFRRDPRIEWMTWQDDAGQRIDAATAYIERETAWTS